MTAALERVQWASARPGRNLPPGKTWHPLYRRLGGLQSRSGRANNLVPTGIRSRTTDTHLEHVIFFAFPRQEWLRQRALILRYSSCL